MFVSTMYSGINLTFLCPLDRCTYTLCQALLRTKENQLTHNIGQLIDGPQNGPAPGPWYIASQPNQLFQDHEKHLEVPHTASIKMCHGCEGAGMIKCWKCKGRKKVMTQLSTSILKKGCIML